MALFETFKDNFDTGLNSSKWSSSNAYVSSGKVNLAINTSGSVIITTNQSLTLIDSYVSAWISPSPDTVTTFTVTDDPGNDELTIEYNPAGVLSVIINSTRHENVATISGAANWRIRHTSGTAYFEIAQNSHQWTVIYSEPYTFTSTYQTAWVHTWAVPALPKFPETTKVDDFNFPINSSLTSSADMLGTSDTTATYTKQLKRDVDILSTSGMGSYYVINRQGALASEKKYLYKVYDENGNFVSVYDDVISDPSFNHEVNTIGSSMTLELARNSDSLAQTEAPLLAENGTQLITEDSFPIMASTTSKRKVGLGSDVQHNYRVDVYTYYGSTEPLMTEKGEPITTEDGEALLVELGYPNGIRIFTGFISDIDIRYGKSETTVITLNTFGWDLHQYPLLNSGSPVVTYNSQDPSTIARNVLDKFMAETPANYKNYTVRSTNSIEMTSTVVSYTFKNNTYREALEKVLELMPSDWFYYVGLGDNTVYYKKRHDTIDHLFYLGREIISLDLKSYITDSFNDVIFTGGGDPALVKRYTAAPAQGTRRRLDRYSDNRVTLESSAQIISQGILDGNNKIQYKTTLEISSVVYDIESIKVGDSIGFRNFDNNVDSLVMTVVGISYTPDKVQLALNTLPPTVNKRLEDLYRNLKVEENQSVGNTAI